MNYERMIRNIEVENCFSFLKPATLSFVVNNKAPSKPPEGNKYEKSIVEGDRISKVVGIYGKNGSGKSNLLEVIKFLKWFILDSFGENPDEDFPLRPFLLQSKPYGSMRIKIEFEIEKKIYRYEVIIDPSLSAVMKECLEILDLNQDNKPARLRFKNLFNRVYDPEKEIYSIRSASDFGLGEGIKDLAKKRQNASLVSAALFTNHKNSQSIKKFWKSVKTKMKRLGMGHPPIDYYIFRSTEFYHKNEQYKSSMIDILVKCDLGLVGLEIEKVEVPNGNSASNKRQEFYMPFGVHKGIEKKEHRLPFPMESNGTQQIYVLLSYLLPVLENGGIAIIDEIETDMHMDILPKLLNFFEDPKTNPKSAQLIFSSHATPLLDSFDKYQVAIVEKSNEGISSVERLDQKSGVRSDVSIYFKYLKGELGGVPNLESFSD